MPKSIPTGLRQEHILKAIEELDSGIQHGFGDITQYRLVRDGKSYPPKAVIGLAFRHFNGQVLSPEDFSGGEAPGQANFVLRNLGFEVVRNEKERFITGSDWIEEEIQLLIADYMSMLNLETNRVKYSKSEYRKDLAGKLNGRSEGAIEFKHQNLSAVLIEMGLPYIRGYKPRGNYQAMLHEQVAIFLRENPDSVMMLAKAASNGKDVQDSKFSEFDNVEVGRPESLFSFAKKKPWINRKVSAIDFAEQDAENRALGKSAEEFVLRFEMARLRKNGRDDLANKVSWVSEVIGDGLGYDILSFNEKDGSERFIEVKATKLGKHFPFFITHNELACSEDVPEKYFLYRVFDFSSFPRLYMIQGSLRQYLQLEPVLYRTSGMPKL